MHSIRSHGLPLCHHQSLLIPAVMPLTKEHLEIQFLSIGSLTNSSCTPVLVPALAPNSPLHLTRFSNAVDPWVWLLTCDVCIGCALMLALKTRTEVTGSIVRSVLHCAPDMYAPVVPCEATTSAQAAGQSRPGVAPHISPALASFVNLLYRSRFEA